MHSEKSKVAFITGVVLNINGGAYT